MILKCLHFTMPTTRGSQLISSLVYGRESYEGYKYNNGDVIDQLIIETLAAFTKSDRAGNLQLGFRVNEAFNSEKNYRDIYYRNQFNHGCRLQINQTGVNDLSMQEMEYLKKIDYSFNPINVDLYYINSREEGHDDLQVLPKLLSITVDIKTFIDLSKTISSIEI